MVIEPLMSPGDVARVLGVTSAHVRQLDDELEPIRLPNGHRRYRVDAVQKLAKKRTTPRAG
jgi:hypothetical protein